MALNKLLEIKEYNKLVKKINDSDISLYEFKNLSKSSIISFLVRFPVQMSAIIKLAFSDEKLFETKFTYLNEGNCNRCGSIDNKDLMIHLNTINGKENYSCMKCYEFIYEITIRDY